MTMTMTMSRGMILVLALLVPAASAASDDAVYESFHGVQIGRVFLSQQRRDALDRRRLLAPEDRSPVAGTPAASSPKPKATAAAGYIIGPNGRSKTWRNGDFVASKGDASHEMSFPGDVKITRHEAESAVKDDEAD